MGWGKVSREVLGELLSRADWQTVLNGRRVNKHWKTNIDNPELYKRLFRDFGRWAPKPWSGLTISCVQEDVKEFQLLKAVPPSKMPPHFCSVCLYPIENDKVWIAAIREAEIFSWSATVQLWNVESSKLLRNENLGDTLGTLVVATKASGHLVRVNGLKTIHKIFHLDTEKKHELSPGLLSNICKGHVACINCKWYGMSHKLDKISIFDLGDLEKKPKVLTPQLPEEASFIDLLGGVPCILTPSIVLVPSKRDGWWVVMSREDGSFLRHVEIQGGIYSLPFGLFANGERVERYSLNHGLREVNGCKWAEWENIFVRPGPGTFSFLCQHVGDPVLMLERRTTLREVDQFLLDSEGKILGKLGLVFRYAFDGARLACDQGDKITIFNLKDGKLEKTESYKLKITGSCRSLGFSDKYLIVVLQDGKLLCIPLVLPKSKSE